MKTLKNKLFKTIILLLFISLNAHSQILPKASGADTVIDGPEVVLRYTLAGTWETSNGYKLEIDSTGLGSFMIPGSSTKYRVVTSNPTLYPYTDPSDPAGQPAAAVSIAIQFASIGQTQSVNYLPVASLTGQLYLSPEDGTPTLDMFMTYSGTNSLVGLQAFKNYGETLTFSLASTNFTKINESPGVKCEVCEIYLGQWNDLERVIDPSGKEIFDIRITYISQDGRVKALMHASDEYLPLTGFIGNSTSEYSKSITLILDPSVNESYATLSITGILSKYDLNTGATIDGLFTLARATGAKNRYSAVNVRRKIWGIDGSVIDPIEFDSFSLNYTDNGAANWVSGMQFGISTDRQLAKVAFDTGGSFDWVNSTQCKQSPCPDYGHLQFDPYRSKSFQWIDQDPHQVIWGPWGNAMANTGRDYIYFLDGDERIINNVRKPFKLITEFDNTPQFQEFLWDGGLALPSYSNRSDVSRTEVDNIMIDLLNAGKLNPDKVCVAFSYDRASGTGDVEIGGWSPEKADLNSKVVLKRKAHANPGIGYLWTFALDQVLVGNEAVSISDDAVFGFDTGSSALKGDATKMTETKNSVSKQHKVTGVYPNLNYVMGTREDGSAAKFSLPASQYVRHIDEGSNAGTDQIQIQTLDGVPDLWVQGTTIMEDLYVVFWYDVELSAQNELVLEAGDVWAFNKTNGPEIIVDEFTNGPSPEPSPVDPLIVYPNPVKLSDGNMTVRLYSESAQSSGTLWYYIKSASDGSTISVGNVPALVEGTNEFQISTSSLTTGSYILDINGVGSIGLKSFRFTTE